MTNKLVVAGAGSGKSTLIVEQALRDNGDCRKVLLLTYTERNQQELLAKFIEIGTTKPSYVRIKGWFRFLLEEMIRPYQSCIFSRRLDSINFNASNPHKVNKVQIPGRKAEIGGVANPKHYLTSAADKAHTMFLSKLACKINAQSGGSMIKRIGSIYRLILIDEIQDLVGWDYEILKLLTASAAELTCVGDFRQTIYTTAYSTKSPATPDEKRKFFVDARFQIEEKNENYRSVQPICDFADEIHAGAFSYLPSRSQVAFVASEYSNHVGVFAVGDENLDEYIRTFDPVILRLSRSTRNDICKGRTAINFGESKGMEFDRVLVLTTDNQSAFLKGETTVFDTGKTEKARNAFYVAATRARYSVAFLLDDAPHFDGVTVWRP